MIHMENKITLTLINIVMVEEVALVIAEEAKAIDPDIIITSAIIIKITTTKVAIIIFEEIIIMAAVVTGGEIVHLYNKATDK